MSVATIMLDAPVDRLDAQFLDDNQRMRALFPAEAFAEFTPDLLKLWCHHRARYAVPTLELVTWLRARIAGRDAIEIAAGNGDVGYLTGIRETDSYIQQTPALRLLYRSIGQRPTSPAQAVRRLDALDAIDKFKPKVVIAAWPTRKFEPGKDVEGHAQASVYGVREEEILERVQTYIHIGNEQVHGEKTILRLPHETIKFPGLLSRSSDQSTNVIHVWERQ